MKTKSKLLNIKPINGYDIKLKKRNERERKRVECLNSVYDHLKQHIPDSVQDKKMSKFNIIMNAIKYIQLLTSILNENNHNKQYYYAEQLCQANTDKSIIGNNFNEDMSQSQEITSLNYFQYNHNMFQCGQSQEINSLNYFQYTNNMFQCGQNVIRENYNQCFENCNQDIYIDNYSQYNDVLYENDYNQ